MSSYKTNQSPDQIHIGVTLISPAPAKTFVELDGHEILQSPDFSGGNLLPTALASNADCQDKTIKVTTLIDLSPLTEAQKTQAMEMIRINYSLDGGPDGLKQYRLHKTKWVRVFDDLFLNKFIDCIS